MRLDDCLSSSSSLVFYTIIEFINPLVKVFSMHMCLKSVLSQWEPINFIILSDTSFFLFYKCKVSPHVCSSLLRKFFTCSMVILFHNTCASKVFQCVSSLHFSHICFVISAFFAVLYSLTIHLAILVL
jgi:hypothetical protein